MAVRLTDGTVLDVDVPHSWGLPENPLSVAEVERKFYYLTDPVMPAGRPRRIVEAVADVTSLKSVRQLVDLLVVGGDRRAAAQ